MRSRRRSTPWSRGCTVSSSKTTVKQLSSEAAELLRLRPMVERYKELEQLLREGMIEIGYTQIDVSGRGRVWCQETERVTVDPAVVRSVLGEQRAEKVIQKKESVPNRLLNTFAEIGDISGSEMDQILAEAERVKVVNLYVRPLK